MKKFNNFADFGKYMKVSPRPKKDAPATKCAICGTAMTNIPGTNVFVCPGKNEEGKLCERSFCKPVRKPANGLI